MKINWGELGKYLPAKLLDKTNISEFITQKIVDEFNAVLTTKNPNRISDAKREWDYYEFYTKNGWFSTETIYDYAVWTDPKYDKLICHITFLRNGKKYFVSGLNYGKIKRIEISDGTSNRMVYQNNGGIILYYNKHCMFSIYDVEMPTDEMRRYTDYTNI